MSELYRVEDERLTRLPRVREVESSNPKGRQNLTQCCKRFATTSISTQELPWRYNAKMGTTTHYRLWRNTESIMRSLYELSMEIKKLFVWIFRIRSLKKTKEQDDKTIKLENLFDHSKPNLLLYSPRITPKRVTS